MNIIKRFLILIPVAAVVFLISCESNDNPTNSVYIPQPVNKKVLLEYFSNSSCVPCIEMHRSFIEPIDAVSGVTINDTSIVFVSWQYKYPNTQDSVYWANPVQNAYRAAYYQVLGAPQGNLDGNYMGSYSTQEWASQVNTEFDSTRYLNILLANTYDSIARTGSISANVQTLVTPSTNDNVIHFILTENNVNYISASNGIKVLNDVMRLMITDTSGVPFTFGGTQTITKNYSVDHKFVDSNCHLVVFIQSYGSQKVYGVEKIAVK
ncbi:MAG: Omp28-related outer membrane protein [Ignavibacteria bacterium]